MKTWLPLAFAGLLIPLPVLAQTSGAEQPAKVDIQAQDDMTDAEISGASGLTQDAGPASAKAEPDAMNARTPGVSATDMALKPAEVKMATDRGATVADTVSDDGAQSQAPQPEMVAEETVALGDDAAPGGTVDPDAAETLETEDGADASDALDLPQIDPGGSDPDTVGAATDMAPSEAPSDPAPSMASEAEVADASGDALPETETRPAPDPVSVATATCLETLGPANAGVPSASVDAASQKEALAEAAPFCTEAARAEDADPEVLFHAATIARARGDATATYDLLTRAAKAGLGPAETRLGDFFLFGVGPEGQNVMKAVTHYRAAADLGDPAGMTTLALLHQVGQGVPRDTKRMIELMTKAADEGYHFAQFRLAQTLMTGEGVAGRSDPDLGIPDPERAVAYYTMAAEAGNLSAALELSSLYADPNSGLPDNPAAQVRLTRMVSQTGHPPAIAKMGVFYETGRGVDRDPEIAAGLYVRAMETGKLDFGDLRNGAPGAWDRDTALAFQKVLKDRGLYNGPLDAIVGGGTAAAARALADQ